MPGHLSFVIDRFSFVVGNPFDFFVSISCKFVDRSFGLIIRDSEMAQRETRNDKWTSDSLAPVKSAP